MSEFAIILPVLLLLTLGAIQFGLLYHTKATLNLAAFEAARAGALNQGKTTAMNLGLANGLRPLFTHGTDHGDVQKGFDTAKQEVQAYTHIEVINPTPGALKFWKGRIPNGNLLYSRETTPTGLSIQDANLLKVMVTYCAPLHVPFLNRTIVALAGGNASGFAKTCYDNRRLPIIAQAIVRMQSDYCPSCS